MKKISSLLLTIVIICSSFFQIEFKTIQGTKANYTISVPSTYKISSAIGKNVDIKFIDDNGASIITVLKKLSGIQEKDIEIMGAQSDSEIKTQLEATGLQNITVINKGFTYVNDVKSFFIYYKNNSLYFHQISQFRKGNILTLTYACFNSQRDSYMPYIYRVANSIEWK